MFAKVKALASDLQLSKLMLISVQNSKGFWARFGFVPSEELSDEMLAKLRSYGSEAYLMIASIGE